MGDVAGRDAKKGGGPIGANFVIFAATSETESASETVVSLAALVVVGRHVTTA